MTDENKNDPTKSNLPALNDIDEKRKEMDKKFKEDLKDLVGKSIGSMKGKILLKAMNQA